MRYFVELQNQDGCYQGAIHQGNPAIARPLTELKLDPEAEVNIKGQAYRLGDLVQALLNYQPADLKIAYEERGQLELGQYLYAQIFGNINPTALKGPQDELIDLRIVTDDEHLVRLPWILLAHKGVFLSTAGWSVSLARNAHVKDCELPAAPKMLIVAPEPTGVEKTRAKPHLETLESRLSLYDYRLSCDHDLKVAYTWEQFREQLQAFQPDIIYYYGHGVGDQYQSRLVFATGEQYLRVDKPIADFAQYLRNAPNLPKLVYLNCCSGDAGGFLGAGMQLGEFIPAVITNRTVAHIDAAQAQALALWQSILLDGRPPHLAMSEILSKLTDLNLSFSDARWMTPVLHCHYANWKSTPPQRVDPLDHDPHWHLKLDRVVQFSTVSFQTRQMLRERRPRSLAYVWYGEEGQGVDLFHKRLKIELQEDLASNAHFLEVQPEWPAELHDPDRSYSDMLCEVFDVQALADIPQSIRKHTLGATGRQTLVYVRHQPVRSAKLFNPRTLKEYLNWWDKRFVPLLKEQCYALLTVSFVVNNPAKFYKSAMETEHLYDLELSGTVFRLLDQLERLALKDLHDFLQTHNIRLPAGRKERLLQDILERTQGHYELTISELQRIVKRAWDEPEAKATAKEAAAEEFDY